MVVRRTLPFIGSAFGGTLPAGVGFVLTGSTSGTLAMTTNTIANQLILTNLGAVTIVSSGGLNLNGSGGTGISISSQNITFANGTNPLSVQFGNSTSPKVHIITAVANSDVCGTATITAGNTSVTVTFAQTFTSAPVVVATPTSNPSGNFWVVPAAGSFTINIPAALGANLTFMYHVMGNPN